MNGERILNRLAWPVRWGIEASLSCASENMHDAKALSYGVGQLNAWRERIEFSSNSDVME